MFLFTDPNLSSFQEYRLSSPAGQARPRAAATVVNATDGTLLADGPSVFGARLRQWPRGKDWAPSAQETREPDLDLPQEGVP